MTEVNDNDSENDADTHVNPTMRQSATPGFSAANANEANANEPRVPVEKHSALVGYMSVPVHRRLPIRRSTLLLIILFLGFGTLCYLYPPNSGSITCTASGTCSDAGGNIVGILTTTTSTTTTSTTTSTTSTTNPNITTTTTVRPTTSTTSSTHTGSPTTTTANQPTSTTSVSTGSSTTSQPGTSGSTTTSSVPGVSGTDTSTTTTVP